MIIPSLDHDDDDVDDEGTYQASHSHLALGKRVIP